MLALIVDDSRAMRTILSRIIAPLGFEVIVAVHGVDALDKLQSGALPDLMLVDWNMPEMNGYELLKKVRADAAYASIKIVMVTTETEITQIASALSAGADEYVMKPFTSEVICEKLCLLGLAAGE